LVNIQLPRGKKLRDPAKLFRFEWEKEQDYKAQDKGEMLNMVKLIAKFGGTRKKVKQ
jgi:hypothetical protein